jgi:hypothetical protein
MQASLAVPLAHASTIRAGLAKSAAAVAMVAAAALQASRADT